MKGGDEGVVITGRGRRGYGKGLLLGGVGALSAPREMMFPLCNVKECTANTAYIKECDGCSGN